jgi:putative tricarboxylic transport membrane protein
LRRTATETAVGVGTVAVGAGLAVGAAQISSAAGYAGVGPNFLAWVVASMLLAGGALLVWQARTGGFREREEPSGSANGYWPGFAWVSAGLLVNAALITRIGFILSCVVCFVLAARGFKSAEGRRDMSPRAWLFDATVGFAIAAPVYWMFAQLLGINLPGLTSTGWI